MFLTLFKLQNDYRKIAILYNFPNIAFRVNYDLIYKCLRVKVFTGLSWSKPTLSTFTDFHFKDMSVVVAKKQKEHSDLNRSL